MWSKVLPSGKHLKTVLAGGGHRVEASNVSDAGPRWAAKARHETSIPKAQVRGWTNDPSGARYGLLLPDLTAVWRKGASRANLSSLENNPRRLRPQKGGNKNPPRRFSRVVSRENQTWRNSNIRPDRMPNPWRAARTNPRPANLRKDRHVDEIRASAPPPRLLRKWLVWPRRHPSIFARRRENRLR